MVISIIQVLQGKGSPKQLGAGFAFGAMLGLIPSTSLLNLAVLICMYYFNVNVGMAVLAAILYKVIGIILSRWTDILGYFLLAGIPVLKPFWTLLYNLPIIPWTRFNNTVVMGSFVLSLVLFIPHYHVAKHIMHAYQRVVHPWVEKQLIRFKFIQWVRGTKFYDWYQKYTHIKQALGK